MIRIIRGATIYRSPLNKVSLKNYFLNENRYIE